ncbi:MAG: CvpA family protein [Treponema sp.]|nr:CvpA family protein [Treponema sp.]
MTDIPTIDIIFFLLIVLMIIHGYVKGFVRELFSWAPVVLAVYVAFFLCPQGAAFIRTHTMEDVRIVPEILAFIAIFLSIMILVKILEHILRDVVEGMNLGAVDKMFGAVFGLAEGIALTALILFVFTVQPLFDTASIIMDSVFAQYLLPIINTYLVS